MFSIIIPTFNNLDYLKICIQSIRKNSKYKHQILVHVNEGKDGTKKYLDSKNITYTWTSENVGLCKAVNLASAKSKKKYIVYSHDDFYFCPNWDKYLLDEIRNIGHNNFYISGTMFDTLNNKKFFCGNSYKNFNERKLLDNYKFFKINNYQGSTWAPHIVHKKIWEKVNGFSEEFFPGAGSDPDFAMKLWKNNVRIFKGISKSLVYHFGSKTLRNKKVKLHNKLGSRSSKLFLKKWSISISFFKKHYLKSGSNYYGPLSDPNINFFYLFDLLICKIKYIYIKIYNV